MKLSTSLPMPHVPTPIIEPFTKAEIQALIENCYHTALAQTDKRRSWRYDRQEAYRDVAILLTLIDTGIRAREIHRLDRGDIDLRQQNLEVRPHRSGSKSRPRIIPFSRDTQAALLRWFSQRREMDMVRRYLNFAREDVQAAHRRASPVARWRLYIPK